MPYGLIGLQGILTRQAMTVPFNAAKSAGMETKRSPDFQPLKRLKLTVEPEPLREVSSKDYKPRPPLEDGMDNDKGMCGSPHCDAVRDAQPFYIPRPKAPQPPKR